MNKEVTQKGMRILRFFWPGLLLLMFLISCGKKTESVSKSVPHAPSETIENPVTLRFSLYVNRDAYLATDFGEPPQMAVWLEHPDGTFYKTVFVTHRAGANDWVGKLDCPVALPFWESQWRPLSGKFQKRSSFDAVTGATPKGGWLRVTTRVPMDTRWIYFVEVNVSSDFNRFFPYWSKEGAPDDVGNGQPSLVYTGQIVAKAGQSSVPKLLGFTDQFSPVDTLNKDFGKITTAKNLVSKIMVKAVKN